jgi:hypothetical protein
MGLTKYETETGILWNDEERHATVYTRHKRIMRQMEKRGVKPVDTQYQGSEVISCCYHVPKSWIKITPPRKVSEKQREAARRNIEKAQAKNARIIGELEG